MVVVSTDTHAPADGDGPGPVEGEAGDAVLPRGVAPEAPGLHDQGGPVVVVVACLCGWLWVGCGGPVSVG